MKNTARYFSENAFWQKLSHSVGMAGERVIEVALVLYYCYRDPATPPKARAVILGALGYLILPLDAIPDFIPGVGFADDFAALTAALAVLWAYVKPVHRRYAHEKLRRWFPHQEQS